MNKTVFTNNPLNELNLRNDANWIKSIKEDRGQAINFCNEKSYNPSSDTQKF